MSKLHMICFLALVLGTVGGNVYAIRNKPKLKEIEAAKVCEWDSVTAETWAVADTFSQLPPAAIVFERVSLDDEGLMDRKCLVTVYRRILVLSAEGRKWADVTIPIEDWRQKVKGVQARTVLESGDTIGFDPTTISKKEVFKARGESVKEYAFSLPGVTEHCLVEYAYRLQMPGNYDVWQISREIPLLHGELRWKYFKLGKSEYGDPQWWSYYFLRNYTIPNYVVLNFGKPLRPVTRPNIIEPVEQVFTVNNVEAFQSEQQSLPEKFIRGQVRMYYTDNSAPAAFWSRLSDSYMSAMEKAEKAASKVKDICKPFDTLSTPIEKIQAAYNWLQDSIDNLSYRPADDTLQVDDDFRDFKFNDLIKNRKGTRDAINSLFYMMLRRMNVDAQIVFATDRDDDILVEAAKYWQFNRSIVAVETDQEQLAFYAPGEKYLPAGEVPWTNEGVRALATKPVSQLFTAIPYSSADVNRLSRTVKLTLGDDQSMTGSISEIRRGQEAALVRRAYLTTATADRLATLTSILEEGYPGADLTDLVTESLLVVHNPLKLSATLNYGDPQIIESGGRMILTPLRYVEPPQNPFTAATRQTPIMFPFAYQQDDYVSITLPADWMIESLPSDTSESTAVGQTVLQFFTADTAITVHRRFCLASPFYQPKDYGQLQRMFEANIRNSNATISLIRRAE